MSLAHKSLVYPWHLHVLCRHDVVLVAIYALDHLYTSMDRSVHSTELLDRLTQSLLWVINYISYSE
jgi:hypothetical protein